MALASRYRGLSALDRSAATVLVAIAVGFVLWAIWLAARDVAPLLETPTDNLQLFDVREPPPPPPFRKEARRTHRASPADIGRTEHSADPRKLSAPAARAAPTPVSLVPITTTPLIPVALEPDSGVLGRSLGEGAGGGSGGSGGHGGGGGGTDPGTPVRAVWIRPPSAADFAREWPNDARSVAMSVQVVLICAVTHDGKPRKCTVKRESVAGRGFGSAAIRLAEQSLVKPAMVGDKRFSDYVVIPIAFTVKPPPAKPAAAVNH